MRIDTFRLIGGVCACAFVRTWNSKQKQKPTNQPWPLKTKSEKKNDDFWKFKKKKDSFLFQIKTNSNETRNERSDARNYLYIYIYYFFFGFRFGNTIANRPSYSSFIPLPFIGPVKQPITFPHYSKHHRADKQTNKQKKSDKANLSQQTDPSPSFLAFGVCLRQSQPNQRNKE